MLFFRYLYEDIGVYSRPDEDKKPRKERVPFYRRLIKELPTVGRAEGPEAFPLVVRVKDRFNNYVGAGTTVWFNITTTGLNGDAIFSPSGNSTEETPADRVEKVEILDAPRPLPVVPSSRVLRTRRCRVCGRLGRWFRTAPASRRWRGRPAASP